jgi:phosphotransferase system  glucose/maltose/N-acetylglucosamine-specific IIC component
MVLQGLLDYLFYYVLWEYDSNWIVLVRYILPTALYTTLVFPLFYFLVRRIQRKLEEAVKQ